MGTKCSNLKINHRKTNTDHPLFWILGGNINVCGGDSLAATKSDTRTSAMRLTILKTTQWNSYIVRDGLCSHSAQSIIFTAKVSSLSPALPLVRKSVLRNIRSFFPVSFPTSTAARWQGSLLSRQTKTVYVPMRLFPFPLPKHIRMITRKMSEVVHLARLFLDFCCVLLVNMFLNLHFYEIYCEDLSK